MPARLCRADVVDLPAAAAGCCGVGRDADATERLTGQLFGAASSREHPPCHGPQRFRGDTVRSDGRANRRPSGWRSIPYLTFPDEDSHLYRAGGCNSCRAGGCAGQPRPDKKGLLLGSRLDLSGSENTCAVTKPRSDPARGPTRILLSFLRTPGRDSQLRPPRPEAQ